MATATMSATDTADLRSLHRRTLVSRAHVETVMARFTGIAALVFTAQAVPLMIGQLDAFPLGIGAALAVLTSGTLVAFAVATFTGSFVRAAALAASGVFAVVLVLWPVLVTGGEHLDAAPWIYFVCTVATTAAGLSMRFGHAVAYTIAVTTVYGIVRWLPAGGMAGALFSVLEAVYALILGLVVLLIIRMLRQAAAAVDTAQDAALHRYDDAVRLEANEIERVRIDALVHDSVLTTLLTAASSRTADAEKLAARMAGEAILRLDEASGGDDASAHRVGLTVLVRRLRAALTTYSTPFVVRTLNTGGVEIPVDAIEVLYAATTQAMVNSMQHAGGDDRTPRRELRIRGVRAGGCVIEIADNGVGFEQTHVASDRLGVRVAIVERVEQVGGTASVDSAPGHGTTVQICWPAEAGVSE